MLKQLALLLKLRAWLKSGTLKAGGVVAALGAIQAYLSSQDGIDLVTTVAGWLGLSGPTLGGILVGIVGLAILVLRAITEHSLAAKVAAPPQ